MMLAATRQVVSALSLIAKPMGWPALAATPLHAASSHSKAASEGEDSTVFYNSQAGRWMTKPGALGLRVNELVGCAFGWPAVAAMQAARPSSYELLAVAPRSELAAAVGSQPPGSGITLVLPVACTADVAVLRSSVREGVVLHPRVSLRLGPSLDQRQLDEAAGLVRDSVAAGLMPHVLLRHAWAATDGDPDDNAHAGSLAEAALALVDAEAAVITLSDCSGSASDDSLRDAVEALFNIDCAGESMMERLALRLPRADLCSPALRLGVTRFDACACPHAPAAPADEAGEGPGCSWRAEAGSEPAAAGEPAGSCRCCASLGGQVVRTADVVAAAERQGIKHRLRSEALRVVRF